MNIRKPESVIILIIFAFAFISCASAPPAAKISALQDYNVKGNAGDLVRDGKLSEAKAEIEKMLAQNPNDANALYMKGIVNLQEKSDAAITYSVLRNESIFNPEEGYLTDPSLTNVLSKEVAIETAEIWKKALAADKTRKDIYITLCNLYTDALMEADLKTQFRAMKIAFPEEKLAYAMGGFARKFFNMGQSTAAINIYNTIAVLYKDEPGVYSDMASISFMDGNFQEAVRYIGIAYRMGNPDQITAYNFFLVNIITGNYPKAIEALKSIQGSNLWKFYDGLNQYYTNNPGHKTALNDYIAAPGGSEDNEIGIAKFLVSDENKDDFESFTKSIKGEKWINHIILLKRAMAKFPNEFNPMFSYAKIMVYYKNYYEAYNTFRIIESKNIQLDAVRQSSFNFYNAYTFNQLKMVIKANTVWQTLMSDGDFYKRTAACYFYGKSLNTYGRKDEAVTVFKKGAEDGGGSKYSAFCSEFLKSAAPQISAPQTTVPAQ